MLRASLVASAQQPQAALTDVDFVRDIQPILSDACYHCHGPDAGKREAKLRLDTELGAKRDRGGWAAVVPGKPDESELIQRINAEDEFDLMPPPDSHRSLNVAQRELLSRWVQQGALWSEHWSFKAPVAAPLPAVTDVAWPRNAIDHFVQARLDQEGLRPTQQASDATLLRRLSLDLIGLPPTPQELDEYLQSSVELRFESAVERLLANPAYGERMAWPWLDAARYADSNGYQGDKDRSMWPWRDWVVAAFNDNLPFDEFTIWQIAGDLLPEATHEQQLATAFLRNHMINGEGGRIAEENRVEYIFDQLETVGTVWLGLTMNCCRCHDHKYDPLTNRNYYELFAFFNQTPVTGSSDNPRTAPALAVPDAQEKLRIAELEQEIKAATTQLELRVAELETQRNPWEQALLAELQRSPWTILHPARATAEHQDLQILEDHSILASGENPLNDTYRILLPVPSVPIAALRLEALRDASMTAGGMARSDTGDFVITGFEVRVLPAQTAADSTPAAEDAVIAIRGARASVEEDGLPVSKTLDQDKNSGWGVWRGKPIAQDHEAIFSFKEPLTVDAGHLLQITIRHDSKHEHHNLGKLRLSVTEQPAPRLEKDRAQLQSVLSTEAPARTPKQNALVQKNYLAQDQRHVQLRAEHGAASKALGSVRKGVTQVMIMGDQLAQPRESFMLRMGLYNQPGEKVRAALPAVLPALPADSKADRLSLARWLVAPENPLTARVIVNRLWTQLFGTGLVRTAENFGSQGARPSHPALLDWLATEFVRSGWDVKGLMRLMVNSATYRQSSVVTPELQERDPRNTLLGRGPRFRLPSWMIRDQALRVSGLAATQSGGPGVRPYQPAGVWREYTFGKRTYRPDEGDGLYRRSLYTFWRRIVAPTMFFDAASRQTCSVGSRRTNTPLHALVTLNDTTYVEAARALASRILLEAGKNDVARIERAFLLLLSRPPVEQELQLLQRSIQRLRQQYAQDKEAAEQLLGVGQSARDPALDPVEHAAWTGLSLALLNLDETLTKE